MSDDSAPPPPPRQAGPLPRPWRVLSSRVVHADRWLNLRAEACETAAGVLDPYYVLSYTDWVSVVALTDDDRIVTLRHYRHGIREVIRELPGGMMDRSDPGPEQAAIRELREETGYGGGPMRHVCSMPTNPATHDNRLHTFLLTGARELGAHEPELGEDLVVELVPVAEVLAGLGSGTIGQSMQVGGLLLALRMAGRIAF